MYNVSAAVAVTDKTNKQKQNCFNISFKVSHQKDLFFLWFVNFNKTTVYLNLSQTICNTQCHAYITNISKDVSSKDLHKKRVQRGSKVAGFTYLVIFSTKTTMHYSILKH